MQVYRAVLRIAISFFACADKSYACCGGTYSAPVGTNSFV
jgi:hypothetical protein